MSRTLKQFSNSSFYNTHHTDQMPFAHQRRLILSNTEIIDHLAIETDCKLERLRERVTADQAKVERNYLQLEQLATEIDQQCYKMLNEKQIDSLLRNQKENIKAALGENRVRANVLCSKTAQEMVLLRESAQLRERQFQREKQLRESDLMKLIDEFQGELLVVEKQLKQIRASQEEVFDRIEVSTYNVEQDFGSKMEGERQGRKREHETIIKLIGECIEKFTFIY